jgi:hypothetical protein
MVWIRICGSAWLIFSLSLHLTNQQFSTAFDPKRIHRSWVFLLGFHDQPEP